METRKTINGQYFFHFVFGLFFLSDVSCSNFLDKYLTIVMIVTKMPAFEKKSIVL